MKIKKLISTFCIAAVSAGTALGGVSSVAGASEPSGKNETETMVFAAARNQALDDYGVVNGCFKQLGVWESLVTTDDNSAPAPELLESARNSHPKAIRNSQVQSNRNNHCYTTSVLRLLSQREQISHP